MENIFAFFSFDNLDFCPVRHLPALGDISGQPGRFWRFAVMGDPTVTRFLVRDSDSLLSQVSTGERSYAATVAMDVARYVWVLVYSCEMFLLVYLLIKSPIVSPQREKDAVEAWLTSDLTFHVMRDHQYHTQEILSGMWGGRNRHNVIYQPITYQLLRYNKSRAKVREERALSVFSNSSAKGTVPP